MIRIALAYALFILFVPLLLLLGVASMWGQVLQRWGVALRDGAAAAVRRRSDALNRLAGFSA